jgi:hypothetical protein
VGAVVALRRPVARPGHLADQPGLRHDVRGLRHGRGASWPTSCPTSRSRRSASAPATIAAGTRTTR